MSPGWKFVCGVVLIGAAFRELGSHVAPLPRLRNRPTIAGGLVVLALVRDGIERLGAEV